MPWAVFLLLLLGLAACDAAGPGFRGVEPVRREVEGSRFALRIREDRAEAIRVSPEAFPRFQPVARRAALAVQAESGCRVAWVVGDPAMMRLGLACAGRAAPKMPRRPGHFACDLSALVFRDGIGEGALSCGKL